MSGNIYCMPPPPPIEVRDPDFRWLYFLAFIFMVWMCDVKGQGPS